MRVVLITQTPRAARGLSALLQGFGHEPVALLCSRENASPNGEFIKHVQGAPDTLDIVIPAARDRIAPLLRCYEPDVAVCISFPWKVPRDALAVPRFGIVNGHPSLLPRYRGPNPVAWAIRNGERELGFTFHRMDAKFDTGAILAQTPFPLSDEHSWDELEPKLVQAVTELLPRALKRVEHGDPGDPQPEGAGEYFSTFEPNYAWVDWARPVDEIRRKVRAWRFHGLTPGPCGALTELDGEIVRILRVNPEPAEGREMQCADGRLWIVESEAA